jgi:hypothetical protein
LIKNPRFVPFLIFGACLIVLVVVGLVFFHPFSGRGIQRMQRNAKGEMGRRAGPREVMPCDTDREKFCKGQLPSTGLLGCLGEKYELLGKECQGYLQETRKYTLEVIRTCEPDIEKYCKDVAGKKGAPVLHCLRDHDDKLSEACNSARRKLRAFVTGG